MELHFGSSLGHCSYHTRGGNLSNTELCLRTTKSEGLEDGAEGGERWGRGGEKRDSSQREAGLDPVRQASQAIVRGPDFPVKTCLRKILL